MAHQAFTAAACQVVFAAQAKEKDACIVVSI